MNDKDVISDKLFENKHVNTLKSYDAASKTSMKMFILPPNVLQNISVNGNVSSEIHTFQNVLQNSTLKKLETLIMMMTSLSFSFFHCCQKYQGSVAMKHWGVIVLILLPMTNVKAHPLI